MEGLEEQQTFFINIEFREISLVHEVQVIVTCLLVSEYVGVTFLMHCLRLGKQKSLPWLHHVQLCIAIPTCSSQGYFWYTSIPAYLTKWHIN